MLVNEVVPGVRTGVLLVSELVCVGDDVCLFVPTTTTSFFS